MKRSDCTQIGKLIKPHGVNGEISVKFLPQWSKGKKFKKQKSLFVEIYQGDDLVPFFIESAEADLNGAGRIKFEDYNNKDSIQDLTNKNIFISSEIFQNQNEGEFAPNLILGFEVSDINYGIIGIVEDVLDNQKQEMLLLRKGARDILIPWVKEFIVKVDMKEKTIRLKIPDGLIDLNPKH